ncbi:hypothetical protein K1719_012876 [Acacia pycnantha]|nr:hypothetical protein K1719_012876 [Acacia pycnantha]
MLSNFQIRRADLEQGSHGRDMTCEASISLFEARDRECRICHMGLESDKNVYGVPIELGCSCKHDLATAHKLCAETWFKIQGNRTCEICHSVARNVFASNEEANENLRDCNIVIIIRRGDLEQGSHSRDMTAESSISLSEARDRECRICHMGLESDRHVYGVPIELGCSCKHDLAAAHKLCAEKWFRSQGNRTCEVCHFVARNVFATNEETTENLRDRNNVIIQKIKCLSSLEVGTKKETADKYKRL